ncbi:MAG TPA: hypothetical protein VKT32_13215 [Chthonomonadaceae bacterium]|nr:hypothetical protein [Chthonomonadaceae bacterium]
MPGARFQCRLYLHSGIPVVSLEGEWGEAAERLLTETIGGLARAGHYEIIVNMISATRLPLTERPWLERLERLAASVRAHGGHLDIVAALDQIEAGLWRQAHSLLRWAASEDEAICRIVGIPMTVSGPKWRTRLALSQNQRGDQRNLK